MHLRTYCWTGKFLCKLCADPKLMKQNKTSRTHNDNLSPPELLVHLKYSHLGSCAFPYDLDAEWVVGNKDPVKPLVLVSLRSIRNRQWHWNLITICGRIPDLDREGMLVSVCVYVEQASRTDAMK